MATDWKASLPKKRISKRFKFSGNSRSLGNTGAGENGVVEPSKPTAMFQTALGPRMVHEGENMTQRPNGDVEVQPVTQSALAQMEKQRKIPGFQLGGTFRPKPDLAGAVTGAFDTADQNARQPAADYFSSIGVTNPLQSTASAPALNVGAPTVAGPSLNVGAPVVNATGQQTVQPLLPGQTNAAVGLNVGDPVATDGASGGFRHSQPAGAEGGPPIPPTAAPLTPTGTTGLGDQAVAKGLGGLGAIAAGESPVDRTIANRTLGNMSAQQEAERMAAIQAQAQQGVTGPAAQAQQAMLGIAQGSQMGQTAGQLAIGAQERAGGAVRDLATLGQAQQKQDIDIRNAAETDATGYLQNAATSDPNYDWRDDQTAVNKLQKMWEAQGNDGQFTPEWADNQLGIASTTPIDATRNMILGSSWYQEMLETDPERATEIMQGVDLVSVLISLEGLAVTTGPGGGPALYDPITGTIVAGDGAGGTAGGPGVSPALGPQGGGGYDPANPVSVTAAVTAFTDNFASFGVTDNGMSQYLEQNDGALPPDAETFESWSMTNRTFDTGDPDDVTAASDLVAANDRVSESGVNVTSDMMKGWLASNDGKIGDVGDFIDWAANMPNLSTITDFFNGIDGVVLGEKEMQVLEKSVAAKNLFAGGDVTEEQAQEAGFKSVEDAQWHADIVPGGIASLVPAGTPQEQIDGLTTLFGDDWTPRGPGGSVGRIYDFTTSANYIEVNRLPPQQITDFFTTNAGQTISMSVEGEPAREFILANDDDLLVMGAASTDYGGSSGYDGGFTHVPGYYAYDVQAGKWVVLSPTSYSPSMRVGSSPNVNANDGLMRAYPLSTDVDGAYEDPARGWPNT